MTDTAAPPFVAVHDRDLGDLSSEVSPAPQSRERLSTLRRHRAAILCVATYFVLAVLVYLPVSPFDSRQLPIAGAHNPAGADPFQMTWFLSYVPFALSHGQSLFHTNYLNYPAGVNLADNTTVPLLGILGWPITATLGPVATFNFLIRLSFALSGTSMFFVMRRWCRSWGAPFFAGLLYAFGPYTAGQKLHLDLIFIPLLPVLVLLFVELFQRQKMNPVALGALIGLVSGLQYLVSQEVLSGCFAIGVIAAIALAIRYRHELRPRAAYIAKASVVGLVVFAAFAGYPLYEMLYGPAHLRGPVITLQALQATSADLLSPIIPTSNEFASTGLLSHLGDELVNGNLSENSGYLGIPLLILLGVILRRMRKDAVIMTFFWLAVAAFVLSLGSHLVVGTLTSPIPLPEIFLTHVPFFQSTVPARYSLYVLLLLSMVVGIGLERIWFAPRRARLAGEAAWSRADDHARAPDTTEQVARNRSKRRWPAPVLWSGVAGAIVFGSVLPNAPFASKGLVWPASLPRAITRVVKPGSAVLTYPFPDPNTTNMQPMVWQAVDHTEFRLIGGYANVAVAGQSIGRRWPVVLHPQSVQDILGYSDAGDRFREPPPATPSIEAQLRSFLTKYSVGAVVAWMGEQSPSRELIEPGGIDAFASHWTNADGRGDDLIGPAGVYVYLHRALGNPQVHDESVDIWLPVKGAWRAPTP